jgi:tRNA(Ile)-lysidine synthase
VACAVSGGADSLALALLADQWARHRGGQAFVLTVDHGLRPEAADEARRVGAWLEGRGISHTILRWTGPKPSGDIQAAARTERYRLLAEWCRDHGVLHLLLAHHRDDQAETVLLRLGRGSGVDGMAAMAAVAERPEVRLLRPFLAVPKDRLVATLRAEGQDWVEDPSNANTAFARVRLRHLMPALADEGLSAERLAATARRFGRARAALETWLAEVAAAHVSLHPAGWAEADHAAFAVDEEIALRLLARLLMVVSGKTYGPRLERLESLLGTIRAHGASRSLGGCLVDARRRRVRILREPAAVSAPVAVRSGEAVLWDRRFRIVVDGPGGAAARIAALGVDGRVALAEYGVTLPAAVCETVPALVDDGAILAVPHLGYKRASEWSIRFVAWAPAVPLTAVGHCLV